MCVWDKHDIYLPEFYAWERLRVLCNKIWRWIIDPIYYPILWFCFVVKLLEYEFSYQVCHDPNPCMNLDAWLTC